MSQVEWKRIGRVTWVLVKITFGLFVLLMLPDLFRLIPSAARAFWVEALAVVVLIAYGVARWLASAGPEGGEAVDRARRGLAVVDLWVDSAFQRGLVIILGGECLMLLASWVPHYLSWPFSRDEDTFAVLAISWDHGILPYRDIRAFNFPGAIYQFWVLGKVFGWGRTVPFYAADAACVVLLGGVLVFWSRKRLGGTVPGLVGYLAFLQFYLNLGFGITGERDWHTVFLVTVGILILQAVPGRWPRLLAALTTAMALAIRPHAVLFLPAMIAAVMEREDSSGAGWPGRIRNALTWCLWLALFSAMAFAPLVLTGIADDFVRGFLFASYGGPYHKATAFDGLSVFLDQFQNWRLDVPLAVTLLLAVLPKHGLSRITRTWCLAWLGALVYRSVHPVHHVYLIHAVFLVASITWAFPAYCLLSTRRVSRPVLVLAVLILAYEVLPDCPTKCSLEDSVYAIRSLALGKMPVEPPLGCMNPYFRVPHSKPGPTAWNNYCTLLDYLRRTTSPRTMVANILNRYPYEALNGPTGRLSPFLAESGICWMVTVNTDVDPQFADALERADDSVAVWLPHRIDGEPRMRYEKVHAVVRKYYEPAARFDQIEVWRRKIPPP
jgi:hypothetical protein